jgi:hypothetical protein
VLCHDVWVPTYLLSLPHSAFFPHWHPHKRHAALRARQCVPRSASCCKLTLITAAVAVMCAHRARAVLVVPARAGQPQPLMEWRAPRALGAFPETAFRDTAVTPRATARARPVVRRMPGLVRLSYRARLIRDAAPAFVLPLGCVKRCKSNIVCQAECAEKNPVSCAPSQARSDLLLLIPERRM